MGLATVLSRAQNGLRADLVHVEVHVAPGLPALSVVGLPEGAVREARDRVRAAITNAGYRFPDGRITVNLAPADLPKYGGRFDLPIALGILAASGQLPAQALQDLEVLGELSLGGDVRPVRGALPAALRCAELGHALLVPKANAGEAQLADGVTVHYAERLSALGSALHDGGAPLAPPAPPPARTQHATGPDLAEVRGQPHARRALEVAAAGGHSLLMVGPPGSGKSMLAARLPGILPPLTAAAAIEVAAIASVDRGTLDVEHWGQRPFRSPHHSASAVALVGGGSIPRPGEITLAHHGVLFLDELPEFSRPVLEVLREPLETGCITISRAAQQVDFPARFQLVAAMNPCPCGFLGDTSHRCRCTPDQIARYRNRLSGPFLDRIDLQVFVPRIAEAELTARHANEEPSAVVRERVAAARAVQQKRAGKANAALSPAELERDAQPTDAAAKLLHAALTRLSLSARAYHRVLRVARTIADLDHATTIGTAHVAEAIRYRELDRSLDGV
ncbi:MAG: ATP-dependent protease [Nevskiaceae bacterium]|nr:MAG: ATP-dependent protease [Nevskiaceae bacterium]TBR72551.1 MAG: ATP-dependent protease [Nevskiaceae bacterium]